MKKNVSITSVSLPIASVIVPTFPRVGCRFTFVIYLCAPLSSYLAHKPVRGISGISNVEFFSGASFWCVGECLLHLYIASLFVSMMITLL